MGYLIITKNEARGDYEQPSNTVNNQVKRLNIGSKPFLFGLLYEG